MIHTNDGLMAYLFHDLGSTLAAEAHWRLAVRVDSSVSWPHPFLVTLGYEVGFADWGCVCITCLAR